MATPIEQLNAMRGLGENWDGYGAAAPQAKVIDLRRNLSACSKRCSVGHRLSQPNSIIANPPGGGAH